MRRGMRPAMAVAMSLAFAGAVAPTAASGASTPLRVASLADLTDAQARPGQRITISGVVANRSRRAVNGAKIVFALSRTAGQRFAGTRVGSALLGRVRANGRRSFSAQITLPDTTGTFRVRVCSSSPGRSAVCRAPRGALTIAAPPPTATSSPSTQPPAEPVGPQPAPPAPPATPPASAPLPPAPDTRTPQERVRGAITQEGLRARAADLQAIADANGGNRAAGTSGFDDSVSYVVRELAAAGYAPRIQTFLFYFYEQEAPSTFAQVAPTPAAYAEDEDFATTAYSGSGNVTADVTPVDVNLTPPRASTSGCEPEDFDGFPVGNIALVQRGTCNFSVKVTNAEEAGARAVIIFNQGDSADREGLIGATLDGPAGLPVIDTTYALGAELATAAGPRATVTTDTFVEPRTAANVLADTPGGRADRTVVIGAHLDSVGDGPGINDNGSGTAFELELATQMAALGITPVNRVRFAFWGAEEEGLLGSTEYVARLTDEEAAQIALNLNFDMLASPNYARLVYDGDGSDSDEAGPDGSAEIEQAFVDYFDGQGLATLPTAFDGRSDYGPFIDVGIPAGGLFAGAEGIKPAEEVPLFGGEAGVAYDVNYHGAGDTIENLNMTGFEELADGAADVSVRYALDPDLVAPLALTSAARRAPVVAVPRFERRGDRFIR